MFSAAILGNDKENIELEFVYCIIQNESSLPSPATKGKIVLQKANRPTKSKSFIKKSKIRKTKKTYHYCP
jgi:hypothetical protein